MFVSVEREIADLADLDNYVPAPPARPVLQFLSRTDVAAYLGMKSLKSLGKVKLPPPDAQIGSHKGWMPATIDAWRARRPGSGRWGPRMGQRLGGGPGLPPVFRGEKIACIHPTVYESGKRAGRCVACGVVVGDDENLPEQVD